MYPRPLEPTGSGPVCIQIDYTAGEVFSWKPGPEAEAMDAFNQDWTELQGKGYASPPWNLVGRVATEKSATTEGHTSTGCPSVEEPALVPSPDGDASGLSNPPPAEGGSDQADTSGLCAGNNAPAGRLAYLRKRYQDKEISEEGTELLLASWCQKSSHSYDSLFRKWVEWCGQRDSDPVSGPVSEVVNFLAHLYKDGYQYRSLNAYCSAISSMHERVDRYEVGQHPLVSRVMRGAFNLRPPQPRYEATWDVSTVLRYIESLGPSEVLPLHELS